MYVYHLIATASKQNWNTLPLLHNMYILSLSYFISTSKQGNVNNMPVIAELVSTLPLPKSFLRGVRTPPPPGEIQTYLIHIIKLPWYPRPGKKKSLDPQCASMNTHVVSKINVAQRAEKEIHQQWPFLVYRKCSWI